MPQERKLWSKTLVALMCVNFANVLVFFLLMVELVGYYFVHGRKAARRTR